MNQEQSWVTRTNRGLQGVATAAMAVLGGSQCITVDPQRRRIVVDSTSRWRRRQTLQSAA